ncbi:hypothetical protein V1294_002019 [Bradyrhizobium sp. AZCC 1678]
MPNRGKHGKARAAAAETREDIMSSAALSTMSAGAVNAMAAVGAAVIKLHKEPMDEEPEWFWHLFAKCEAKAARIAAQAARAPRSNGDATFIEVYARTLPKLMKTALSAREQALH